MKSHGGILKYTKGLESDVRIAINDFSSAIEEEAEKYGMCRTEISKNMLHHILPAEFMSHYTAHWGIIPKSNDHVKQVMDEFLAFDGTNDDKHAYIVEVACPGRCEEHETLLLTSLIIELFPPFVKKEHIKFEKVTSSSQSSSSSSSSSISSSKYGFL